MVNVPILMRRLREADQSLLHALQQVGPLTFFKDYRTTGSTAADYSLGSATGTMTVSRDASSPATYVDASGVVQTITTSSTPRFTYGFYDSTGFVSRPGLLMEGGSTNLVTHPSQFDNAAWTATNVTVTADTEVAPDATTTADTLTATAANGTVLLAAGVTAQTFSVFLKRKTGTGNVQISADGGSNYTTVTLFTTKWVRVQVTAASAAQTCGIRIVTNGDAVYAWGAQFENVNFASTLIGVNATAALTRGLEKLSYLNSNNRTAATESMFFKLTPFASSASITVSQILLASDTKNRSLIVSSTNSGRFRFAPNSTDSPAVILNLIEADVTAGTSVVGSATCASTGDPNATLYQDAANSVSSDVDWTSPAWGTNFYVGTASNGAGGMYGIVEAIAFFSSAMSASNVATATALL